MGTRFIGLALAGLTALGIAAGALAQEVHYAPEERLDAIDAALIATARQSIDLASYALTDPIVLDALNQAEHRGVMIRLSSIRASAMTSSSLATSPTTLGSSAAARSGA